MQLDEPMTRPTELGGGAAAHDQPLRRMYSDMARVTVEALKNPNPNFQRNVIDTLLQDAMREGASDIHLDPGVSGCVVRFRVNGVLYDTAEFLAEGTQRLVNQVKTAAGIDPLPAFKPLEGRWQHRLEDRTLDLRVTSIPSVAGEKLTIRVLDPKRTGHQLEAIGLSERHFNLVERWAENPDGLFLTVGPTGSGKTTTLYSLLHRFRQTSRSLVTIEDPVEYRLDGMTQVQVSERHELTFATALRSTLRLDPNIVMVGEVRDGDSATAAVDAAVTGRVVMSSMHCRDAASAVTALRNWGVSNHQIAASLRIVVAQRLVRRLDAASRVEVVPDEADHHWLKAVGCEAPEHCYDTHGHAGRHAITGEGRTGIYEVLELNEQDIDLILADASERVIRHALAERSHQTLVNDGLEKVSQGLISLSDLRQAIGIPVLAK